MSELSDRHRPATIGRRVAAYVIDSVVATLILAAAGILVAVSFSTQGALPLPVAIGAAYAVAAAWLLVYTLLQGGGGSIGMRILRLRLVRAPGAQRLGFGRALLRNVVWGFASGIVVGVFSPLFDSSPWRRGWHDRAAGAVMTDASRAQLAAVVANEPDAVAPVAPTVLPPGPILPSADDPALREWTTGGAPRAPGASRPVAPPVSVPRPEGGVISFVPGLSEPSHALGVPSAPAPPRLAPVAAAASPIGAPTLPDPLERTQLKTPARPVAQLRWDDGTQQDVSGRTLFGRNPAPEAGVTVIAVRDETLSLSKTHFELVPDHERAVWVVDRHSTNGVVLRRGAQRQTLTAGVRARVHRGDVLEFGDRHVVIEVCND
ncbi:MAG: RDD family protein [Microbacterium sp.]